MAHEKHKLIAARIETPSPGEREQTAAGRLPEELLSEQVRRLAVFAAVGAGLWTYALATSTIVNPLTLGSPIPAIKVVVEILAIATSAALFFYLPYKGHSPQTKTDAGLVYFMLNAMAVAILNTWARTPVNDSMHLSWNTVVILVSSMIMPATPRKMLAASLVAASMDPLGVWVAHLRGLPVSSAIDTLVLFMPNYACAVVAVLPSHLLYRLGRRLRQAQEMGSYHLVELLGRGGMGEVWRGEHRLLKRGAAIKLVRPELLGAGTDAEARSMLLRFEREAQATAALSSPHTIRVFDFGVTAERTFYYVMELLSGRDLDSLVREFGPVPADRTLFLLRQICHSLADAHARGLVHRDITPANIYACRMGLEYDFVKVLDFGLVKFNDQTSIERTLMTGAHTTTGTPAFMAPEIILNGEVDQRADVYALGCVAYYLLTGQLVFDADTPMKMFVQHLQTTPVPPSQRTEMPIPRELDEIVLACLEKDPSRRPQNADELLRMLRRCRSAETWDNDAARVWWEKHLLDLTGPLTMDAGSPETVDRTLVVH
ncbi:MAG TPA: serine/threonine-protein kinase [Vicinamibacterales bacterium]|jgi:serine/threonine-protein kinase|nr:serine/threonine-protein kinase [Vicinamibacterales bacterium]